MQDLKEKSKSWHEAFGTDRIESAYEKYLGKEFRALFFGLGWVDKDAYMKGDQEFARSFEDISMTVEDMAQEGDTVFCRMKWSGRNTGDVLGIEASGKSFEVIGFCQDKYKDGMVVEHIALFDTDALKAIEGAA